MNYLACLTVLLAVSAPEDAFQSNVRPTEPLTAEEQQKTFHLPPGFEIQLFAAEPDIQKPMNLAIDAAGRLWMSGSVEYPYAAKDGDGHDAIKVLEDTDGDGRADKITTFVDGLNIPIGLYPYRDGVVAYSMPNIWFFRDTDGDGKADKREVLYGPLGVPKDTHGMQNAFRRGFDGWLYVNHGFANETEITVRDGSSVKLQSGNTYRLRLDGSRVEQFSWGQVNPFGSTFLPDGDRITADCHSKPLTLLLRGAYYSSFGKSHDGLGFAPDLMTHSHGSTAICGVVHLTGSNFPPEYQGRLLVGNVMTSRVNQDSLTYAGSTARAIERPDFLSTDDPWFRPVDLQLGPDGAIYIADFYNRIIGHYEVPLEHPGRDKHRARIWRVTYRGQDTKAGGKSDHPLAQADVEKLIDALGSENFSRRMLASDQLADRIGGAAVAPLMAAATNSSSETIRVHALWILHRLQKLPPDVLVNAAQDSSRELLRVHAQRILSETNPWTPALHESVQRGLADQSMLVRRAAADAAGQQKSELVADLLRALPQVPKADSALRYSIRMAIRNQLRRPESWKSLPTESLTDGLRRQIEETALAVPNEHAAEFLYKQLQSSPAATNRLEAQLAHLAVNLPANRLDDLTALVRDKAKQDMDLQAKLLLSLNQRLNQRGVQESAAVRKWGTELAASLLTRKDSDSMWTNRSSGNPWGLESRNSDDGVATTFLSSLPGGEQQMGVLRSKPFSIPPKLKFYICGHLGLPNASAVEKNYVQLKLTDSDKVIAKALPPRNDTARLVEWELGEHAGKNGFLEVVDQLDLDAYAWLAVARFEPPVVEVPSALPVSIAGRQIAAAGLISTMKLSELRNLLLDLIEDAQADWRARQAAATAYLAGSDRPLLAAMCAVLGEPTVDLSLREAIVETISSSDPNNDGKILVKLMQSVPSREQRQVADGLAATATGSGTLVELIERGHAAARLVQDRVIRQKIAAHGIADLEARLDRLTASLPTINLELQRLIDERRREIASRQTNVQSGQEIFTKHCAVCHQVGGKGALVGPQLDGIGNRGLARVIEDVLDPNRNVDATFHVSVLTMADGRVLTGLVRREEGANLILADQQGKEFSVLRSDIDERNLTSSSLMPANVHELLKPDQFYDLMGFLLTLRASQEK